MQEVADGVFCVEGTAVNWALLRDGSELTLIDAGWSGDTGRVEDSIRALGRHPTDVQAILLTHAHLDHMGAINHFHKRYATPVFMSSAEVGHARDGHLEQAQPADIIKRCYRPAALRRPGGHRRRGARSRARGAVARNPRRSRRASPPACEHHQRTPKGDPHG